MDYPVSVCLTMKKLRFSPLKADVRLINVNRGKAARGLDEGDER
jgi:hypothetical protein